MSLSEGNLVCMSLGHHHVNKREVCKICNRHTYRTVTYCERCGEIFKQTNYDKCLACIYGTVTNQFVLLGERTPPETNE